MNFVDWSYLYWPRSLMADKWLMPLALTKESGIEIAASAHNSFGIPSLNVDFTNEVTMWTEEQVHMCGHVRTVDIVAWADDLPFPDSYFNFILNSHLFEHQCNPIKCLLEWWRVVRNDGIIFSIIPHRDAHHLDATRPLTTLDHQLDDYLTNQTTETHPIPGEFEKYGHYHVYDIESYKSLVGLVNHIVGKSILEIIEVAETDDKAINGYTFVHRVLK